MKSVGGGEIIALKVLWAGGGYLQCPEVFSGYTIGETEKEHSPLK